MYKTKSELSPCVFKLLKSLLVRIQRRILIFNCDELKKFRCCHLEKYQDVINEGFLSTLQNKTSKKDIFRNMLEFYLLLLVINQSRASNCASSTIDGFVRNYIVYKDCSVCIVIILAFRIRAYNTFVLEK